MRSSTLRLSQDTGVVQLVDERNGALLMPTILTVTWMPMRVRARGSVSLELKDDEGNVYLTRSVRT